MVESLTSLCQATRELLPGGQYEIIVEHSKYQDKNDHV